MAKTTLIDKTKALVTHAKDGKYTYSEIFHSIQGEGAYTGRNTLWIRFFGCNLQCNGFGQIDPTDPSTYVLPYKEFDVSTVQRVEDLPVFDHGCDTPYSWSARFKGLMHIKSAEEIGDILIGKITNEFNPNGRFDYDGHRIDLCFTGGEPLLPHVQEAIVAIVDELIDRGNWPYKLTVESNGTQELTKEFKAALIRWKEQCNIDFFFSVSPKLWSVAGERPEKAIKPETVAGYYWLRPYDNAAGQLKFVCNGTEECWNELESVVAQFREAGIWWDIFIMKVGATVEGQAGIIPGHDISEPDFVAEVLKRGYHYSGRVHVGIWGNVVGS